MKMRRSLWRKLLVLLFAVLTAVSTFLTVQNYIPATVTSGFALTGAPTVTFTETGDEEFPYLCTINATVKNISSASQKPLLLAVVVSGGGVSETRQVTFPVKSVAAGDSCDVTESFPSKNPYKTVSGVSVTMRNMKSYTLLGSDTAQKIPAYVKALVAISVILFGVFIYSCVALYKSPKKKVHHHHHHHHHHHSSEHSSSEHTHSEHSHSEHSGSGTT